MDINALKERLQNLNKRTSKATDVWKPKDEHEVRCLPYPHGSDPFLEIHFHYDVGDSYSITCPKLNYGKDCAVCDFADQLRSWKDDSGHDKPEGDRKADFEIFKKIQAKARVFIPMVERGKEGDGAKFWGVTPNQAVQILEVCADGDRLEELGIGKDDSKRALEVITNPDKGYDLAVSFRKPGEKGNTKSFTEVVIKGKVRATQLSKDKKTVTEICGQVKNIKEVFPEVSSEEVKRILDKWVNSASSDATVEKKSKEATEKYKTNSSEKADKVGVRSIDDAFGDMLNEA